MDQVAKTLSPAPDEIIVTTHLTQQASVGLPVIIIELKDRITQGVEMNCPSILNARADKRNDTVTGVWIGDESILVSQGYVDLV